MITQHKLLFQQAKLKVPNLKMTKHKQIATMMHQPHNKPLQVKQPKHHKPQKKRSPMIIKKDKRKKKLSKMARMARWLLIKNQFNNNKKSKNYDCLDYNLYYIIYYSKIF